MCDLSEDSVGVFGTSDSIKAMQPFLRKLFERIAKIHNNVFNVLAAFNMRKLVRERCPGFSLYKLHHALIGVVDNHRGKFSDTEALVSSERMLVNSDGARPRIKPHPSFELELFVIKLKHES